MNFNAVIVALYVLAVVAIVAALTGFYLWDFSTTCEGNGGTFSVDGTTAWCRY